MSHRRNAMPPAPSVPGAPAVPGLSFRSIRDARDADAVYELRAGCIERDQVDLLSTMERLPSREEFREALAEILTAGQQDRRLVAEIDGQMVGYTLLDSWPEDDGRWVYLVVGWVLPAWRGLGIGTAMLRWGEQAARRLAAEEHPGERWELAANASSAMPEAMALLLNEGYWVGYTVLEMQLDFAALPPASPLPTGAELRPARPEHVPLISAGIAEAYRDEYPEERFHETWTRDESVERLRDPGHDLALWQIAWAGEQVVGDAIPKIEGGRAFLYDVSVRPAWRRKGLARSLLTRALWDLRERGIEAVRITTVAEFRTRARDLYAGVGFRLLKEFPRYRKTPG